MIPKYESIERKADGTLFRADDKQFKRIKTLIKQCANHDGGFCLLLDDGEKEKCPQAISYGINCRYFRHAVLPSDPDLEAGIFGSKNLKRCKICGNEFVAGSNRAKYCRDCAATVHRKQKTASEQKRRVSVDS